MSHMLATVNKEAADAIDNPPAPPDVGTWVVFKGRAGFSRTRRTEFPALVLGADENGGLSLMVVMEPEDMMMEDRVPFRSHNQPDFYWRHRRKSVEEIGAETDDVVGGVYPRIKAIEEILEGEDKLVEDFEQLNARVKTVEQVLMSDEIEKLEARIAKLEKAGKKGK